MIATAAFVLLFLSLIIQILGLLRKEVPFSFYLLAGTAALLFATTVLRSINMGFIAITNTYESIIFFSAVIALLLFLYRVRAKEKTLPAVTFVGTLVAIVLLAVASSPNLPKEVLPPIPALRSYWLALHVTF